MEHSIINDVAVCIVVAWFLAVAAQILRQNGALAHCHDSGFRSWRFDHARGIACGEKRRMRNRLKVTVYGNETVRIARQP